MNKKLLILGIVILLTSCQPRVDISNNFEDENSELIPLLLTKEELSKISNEFSWHSINSKQKQNVLEPDASAHYELSARMYRGYYQTSSSHITIWHTITRHDIPIDTEKSTSLELGGALDNGVTSTYIPDIVTSGIVTSKCVLLRESRWVCEVDVKYNYVESNIYLSTVKDYEEEVLSNWLNAMVSAVEPRIVLQDFGE